MYACTWTLFVSLHTGGLVVCSFHVPVHALRTLTTTMNTLANVYILFVIFRPGFSRSHQSGEGEREQ